MDMAARPRYEEELLAASIKLRVSARQYYAVLEIARRRGVKPAILWRDMIERMIDEELTAPSS